MEQITLNYDTALVDSYASCREFVAHRVHQQGRPQKSIAADMDYSPSQLSRKLSQSPDDSMRFTLDDLERFMDETRDTSPVLYLVGKYLVGPQHIERLEAELERLKRLSIVDHRA